MVLKRWKFGLAKDTQGNFLEQRCLTLLLVLVITIDIRRINVSFLFFGGLHSSIGESIDKLLWSFNWHKEPFKWLHMFYKLQNTVPLSWQY